MDKTEILAEMPQTISPTSFDLTEPVMNRSMRATVLSKNPEVLIDADAYKVVIADQGNFGRIAMIEKSDEWMAYFVEYEVGDSFVGQPVTQVTLWRDPDSASTQGITTRIFNDVLLGRWSIIMSDSQQTPDGQRFWRGRLAEAASKGLKVGLANMTEGAVRWFDPETQDYRVWISANDAWGTAPSFQNLRYVISH